MYAQKWVCLMSAAVRLYVQSVGGSTAQYKSIVMLLLLSHVVWGGPPKALGEGETFHFSFDCSAHQVCLPVIKQRNILLDRYPKVDSNVVRD